MAHLVEDGEHAAGEVAEIEPEPDAAVAGAEAGAAGVDAEIEPAAAEVEAHRAGDLLPEPSLALERDRAPEHGRSSGRGLAPAMRAASGTSSRRSASNRRPTISLVMPGS